MTISQESERERRIVFRWMTRRSAEVLGPTLERAYPLDAASGFDEAIKAINEAEQQVWGSGGVPDKID